MTLALKVGLTRGLLREAMFSIVSPCRLVISVRKQKLAERTEAIPQAAFKQFAP